MTFSTNSPSFRSQNSPRLFLDNGFNIEKLATDTEKSLESKKEQLEKFLTQQTHIQTSIKEISLSDCGTTIYVKIPKPNSPRSNSADDTIYQFKIEEILNQAQRTTEELDGDEDRSTISNFLYSIISHNDAFKTGLENWSKEAQKEKLDETTTAVQTVWEKALKHIRTFNAQPTGTANEPLTNVDEASLKINFTKKYITYKTLNGELKVIDLVKNKALAESLGIDDAIKAIEKKHSIKVLSLSKSCDRAKDLIKKGRIFDTHFLDKTPQEGKNSYFEKIKKKINTEIEKLSKDRTSNIDAIARLEKFKKALEIKTSKNPNGIDWFAVNLAINTHKKPQSSNLVRKAISTEVKKHGIEAEDNPNLTDYITDVSLLNLKKEDAIKLLEEKSQHKLLPTDSKESLLVRAILYGVNEIAEIDDKGSESFEQFEMLFGVEMTEIKEILENLKTAHTPEGDIVYGTQNPGSAPSTPRHRTISTLPDDETPADSRAASRGRSPSRSSISSNTSGSSNSSETPIRSLGGRGAANTANTDEKMPEDTNALALAVIRKCNARPKALTRTKKNETELRSKIYDFVNAIRPINNSEDDSLSANSLTTSLPQEIKPLDKLALQALWKAETNAHRSQIIDIVQFMKKNKIAETENPWKEALNTPNDTKIKIALEEKTKKEQVDQQVDQIEQTRQRLLTQLRSLQDRTSTNIEESPRETN